MFRTIGLISGGLAFSALGYNLCNNKIYARGTEKVCQIVDFTTPIYKSSELIERTRLLYNIPGVVVGVSYRGDKLWIQGFGYANVELSAPCHEDSVMRIGSISKSATTLLLGKLIEQGKLDLDKSIYEYLGDKFPRKKVEGKVVDITLRQLLNHTSGIRSYKDNEMYINKHYASVYDALEIFSQDDLVHMPGEKFTYSSLAFTLVSACIESALPKGQKFEDALISTFRQGLGMNSTYLDVNASIIPNRSSQYEIVEHVLVNSPEIDNSYKWSGGGLLSSVPDLLKFGNAMMYSYLGGKDGQKGYLSRSIVDQLWTPNNESKRSDIKTGLGWFILDSGDRFAGCGKLMPQKQFLNTGESVGGKACLLIYPEYELVLALIMNTAPRLKSDTIKILQDISEHFLEAITTKKPLESLSVHVTEPLTIRQ